MQNPVLLLTCSIGVIGANSLLLSPIATSVADSFAGAAAADVLIGVSAYGLGTASSALALAPLSDRLGADRVVAAALMLLSLSLGLTAVAPALVVLWVAQAMAGVAAGAALPGIYTLAATVSPPGRELQTMGRVLTGWTLSLVAGVTLSAILTDLLGWRAVFGMLATLSLCLTVTAHRTEFGNIQRGRATSPLTALHVTGLGRALLSAFLTMLAFYGTYTFVGVHLNDAFGQTASAAGLVALAYGAGFGCAAWVDPLLERIGQKPASLRVFAALAAVYTALSWVSGVYAVIVGVAFIWGIFNHLGLNLIVTRLSALDPEQRGAIMGLYSCVTYVAVTLAAIGFAPVYSAGGWAACTAASAFLVILMVVEVALPKARRLQA
ncbi:MFS transporter [Shimia ponticola]|uniref:MFS transporter n=1 Tax=Shimia ponticola TaxID=2582893 RepID=UPI00164A5A8F|nr:MFS transporter [Shimia ponticola]